MKAPVMPSSVMLLASSFFAPTCTTAGTKVANPRFASQLRLLVRIHVLHMQLRGKVRVLVEQILAVAKPCALVVIGDGWRPASDP